MSDPSLSLLMILKVAYIEQIKNYRNDEQIRVYEKQNGVPIFRTTQIYEIGVDLTETLFKHYNCCLNTLSAIVVV